MSLSSEIEREVVRPLMEEGMGLFRPSRRVDADEWV